MLMMTLITSNKMKTCFCSIPRVCVPDPTVHYLILADGQHSVHLPSSFFLDRFSTTRKLNFIDGSKQEIGKTDWKIRENYFHDGVLWAKATGKLHFHV